MGGNTSESEWRGRRVGSRPQLEVGCAHTPRASRGESPDEIEAEFDIREWEEEQTELGCDWNMTGEEVDVVSLIWLGLLVC